jgi:hypothetical protein
MKKLNALAFLIITLLLHGCDNPRAIDQEKFNMSILNQKPVFTINFHATGARYRLYLNGVLIERQGSSQGQNSFEIPVNHWMRSGKNTLDLTVYSNEEGKEIPSSSQIKALLQVRNFGEQENYTLGGFVFKGATYKAAVLDKAYQRDIESFKIVEEGKIKVSELGMIEDAPFDGARKYALTLEIPSNLPLWAFFESDDVPDFIPLSDEEFIGMTTGLNTILQSINDQLILCNID